MTEEPIDDGAPIQEATLWRQDGWTARVVKNEEDEGWAVEMIREGEAEPALVGPWTMGRDKKNPKPLDTAAFNTLVKTAAEVLRRHEQQTHADRHKSLTVSAAEFTRGEGHVALVLEAVVEHGEASVVAVNGTSSAGGGSVAIKEVSGGPGKNGSFPLSTHVLVQDESGQEAEYGLALVRPETEGLEKTASALTAGDTWVALDPDMFHAPEGADGQTVYPYTFPAHALDGSGRTITLGYDAPAHMTVEGLGKSAAAPNVVYITPVALALECDPTAIDCGDGGGGGGGGGTTGPKTYLDLFSLQINERRDDGNEELYVFQQYTDDYAGVEFSKTPKFMFDQTFTAACGVLTSDFDTWNQSPKPDAGGSTVKYDVPDINTGTEYWFTNMATCHSGALGFVPSGADGFPMQALDSRNTRYVMTEDDVDPYQFSQLHNSNWRGDVGTYDFTASVQPISTALNADRWYVGSSDDVYRSSGLRRANIDAVAGRVNALGTMVEYRTGLFRRLLSTDVNGFRYKLSYSN